jgi:predicted phosphodiesterase
MARFLICGDLHAKWQDLNSVMKNVDFNLKIRYDSVIQVGDFGFFPKKFVDLDEFKIVSRSNSGFKYKHLKFHKPVYAIDGNHEDHAWLKTANHADWKEKYNIHYQPRGSWMNIDGYKIGFLGGALHADRKQEGSIDKGTTNYILNKEVKNAIEEWNDVGGMDTIITHSCPSNMKIGMEGHPALFMAVQKYIVDSGFGENNFYDCGELPLKKLYDGLIKKPTFNFYGHFHQSKQTKIDNTDFMCVGSTDSTDHKKYVNPLILDTETGKLEFHDKMAMNFDGEHSTWVI